ncbi:MAG TPA: indole-3-glycerol phosphate synthase TrpC [Pyrinomonadaceae bacterium]|jgi:indole-3-glycerol phosphate synthase|nr:indole-3-glycerol phosphate synthase TrpC [Pyrinomonadaceae bacterium]
MSFLSEIIQRKRQRIASAKQAVPVDSFEIRPNSHRLRQALGGDGLNIIAEFKRRSPSKGPIRVNADLHAIVKSYEAGGAAAISVLTEEDYFSGSLDDLRAVKRSVDLPVLRKDFIVDDYQVYESAAAGADAVLLIVAALEDEKLVSLRKLVEDELGMDALIEVHTREELQRAIACGANLIGVNNRNLHTFEVSLETSLALVTEAPAGTMLISESGLNNSNDLARLHSAGYRGFLIGESLMRSENPEKALRELMSTS